MKILVLGSVGMLGHKVCDAIGDRFEVWGTLRENSAEPFCRDLLKEDCIIAGVDVSNFSSVRNALERSRPDAVVNCIGIVKQRDEAKQAIPSIQVNALFPHQLAELCGDLGVRVVQISTDCVFSGSRGNYSEIDVPDPVDLYGRTKLLGELSHSHCLTLRTSIIGWQLNNHSGLLSWFALQRGKRIKGYKHAIYSGFSTAVLAQLIGDLIETRPDLHGLYQVASEPISKYDLLTRLRDALGWKDIIIESDDQFFCDRSLVVTRFTSATGWRSPSWDSMLEGLAREWPEYKKYYPAP
jgi:dTDP-4-dehydrorhamnose reductase